MSESRNTERRAILDEIFLRIDNKFHEGKFKEVDDELLTVDIEGSSTKVLIAWLIITFAVKSKLSNRSILFSRIKEKFLRDEPDKVEGLLQGLEGCRCGPHRH